MAELTLDEAAEQLGVSRSTVRRRIESGEISGRKETTASGDVWRVTLSDEEGKPVIDEQNGNGEDQAAKPEDLSEGDAAEASSTAAGVQMAGEEMTCAGCGKAIEEADDFVQASFGPVHAEPCSHQSFPRR